VVSYTHNLPGFVGLAGAWAYLGTRDSTAMAAIADAMDFRRALGGEQPIRSYSAQLAKDAGDALVDMWGTRRVADRGERFMTNVALPTADLEVARAAARQLLAQDNIFMVVAQEPSSQVVYTRVSCPIYLALDDVVDAGAKLLSRVNALEPAQAHRQGEEHHASDGLGWDGPGMRF